MLTYNGVDFVADAIESVLDQVTGFGVELIIGDDASTDGTAEVVARYAARYPAVIRAHLHRQRGGGVAGRVNNMHNLNDARGTYIAILDGDDAWLNPGKLHRQVRFLDAHPDYSFVGTDGRVERDGRFVKLHVADELWQDERGFEVTWDLIRRSASTNVVTSSLLMRREALLPLPDYFPSVIAADVYIHHELLRAGRGYCLRGADTLYRRHGDSFVADYMRDPLKRLAYYDDYVRRRDLFPELTRGPGLDEKEGWLLASLMIEAARARRFDVAVRGVTRVRTRNIVPALRRLIDRWRPSDSPR